MHIDDYEFGRIVIDGHEYDGDCLIVRGAVQSNWRRKEGHRLEPDDLRVVLAAKPAILVVGCGASAMMTISPGVRQVLERNDIRLETSDTARAVQRFNELSDRHTDIAGAFHLTC